MAGDLTKFIHRYVKNKTRYKNALESLIDKYGEASDDELDSVVNLSNGNIIRDRKGLFSRENFAFEKFKASKELYKTHDQDEECDDITDFDESIFGKPEENRFLQDVSTYMAGIIDDDCREPSDAETLSTSSSNTSYETVVSDYDEITDTHLDEETQHKQYNCWRSYTVDNGHNTYDEVDGDVNYKTSENVVASNLKITDKNHNYRLSNETFTIESDDGHNQRGNVLTNNKEQNYESQKTDLDIGRQQEEFNDKSWCKINNMNRLKKTLVSSDNIEPRNQQFAVSNEQPLRRTESNLTKTNEQTNKHSQNYETLNFDNQGAENMYETTEEYVRKIKDSAGKTNFVDNVTRPKLNVPMKVSRQPNDLVPSPSHRYYHSKSSDNRVSNERRETGELLSPLQCRKVNVAKVSTTNNTKTFYDYDHEELSKKDSGISTNHDESFAVSTPSHAELPEALTVQNLRQFNQSNLSDSSFFNISMNTSGLTLEKSDHVEKWLNKVSKEREEVDTAESNNEDMTYTDDQQKGRNSKQDILTSEVKMAGKKRLETSKKHDQHVYEKRNISNSTDSRSHLVYPKSPKSMNYLRGLSPHKSYNATPDSERTKVKAHRSQKKLFQQGINAQKHFGEIIMKSSGDCFSPRKKVDYIGKRSISHENDINISDDESNVVPTPPKSRRISDVNRCSKSTQIDPRCFTNSSINSREILHSNNGISNRKVGPADGHLNTSVGISNRKFNQADGYSYSILGDSNNSSMYHGNSFQHHSSSFNQSAMRSLINYRNFESPSLSQSLQSSFQSPSHNSSYNIGQDYSYNNMENVNDDLICLNTYPAQSSVRKLNVSSKPKVRRNLQPIDDRIVAGNLQRNGCHGYTMMSNDTSTDIGHLDTAHTSDHDISASRHQQNSYTMCNFVDNPASIDRNQEMRRSSMSSYIPDTHNSLSNTNNNHSYSLYDESAIQSQNMKSPSKQRRSSLDTRTNQEYDNFNSFNQSSKRGSGYLSQSIDNSDPCYKNDTRQFDRDTSVHLSNDRGQIMKDVRCREINDRSRGYAQYGREQDDSECYDINTNVRSPRQAHRLPSQNQRSPRMSKPANEQKSPRQARATVEQRSPWQPRPSDQKSHRQPRSPNEHGFPWQPRSCEQKSPRQMRSPGELRSTLQPGPSEQKSPRRPQATVENGSPWQQKLCDVRSQGQPRSPDDQRLPRQPRISQDQRSYNERNFGSNQILSEVRHSSNNLISPSRNYHNPTSHKHSNRNMQTDPQHWNIDANSTPLNNRRQFNMSSKTESPLRNSVRTKYVDSQNYENVDSPKRESSNQAPRKPEFMSPSSTSRQIKDDHNDFKSPTINRVIRQNKEFSPSTSLAKMKLHTPKSGSAQRYTASNDCMNDSPNSNLRHSIQQGSNSRLVEQRLTHSGHKKTDSQQTFISLDQMQSNPLLFKIHLIDENQSDKSEDRLRDCNDFSNNYWCDQVYDQQKNTDEREPVNPDDNVYHQYCDEIREDGSQMNESRREATAWTDVSESMFSPSKHSPKTKRSLFSSMNGNNSKSATPQFITKQKSPVFNDFKMPSASVASKLKPTSHNKENIRQSNRNIRPGINGDSQTISDKRTGSIVDRLGGIRQTMGRPSNYMHSTPVKPGIDFTFNNTLSTILPGQDDTEVDEDKDEILLV